jgi:hypothetical protein
MSKHSRDSEIPHFDDALFCHEHILTLYIPMKDFSVVNVFHSQTYLREPVKNFLFIKIPSILLLNHLLQITSICKVHHYAQMTLFCFVNFAEAYDVGMNEGLQNLSFFQCLFSFPFRHLLNVYLFNDTEVFRSLSLN